MKQIYLYLRKTPNAPSLPLLALSFIAGILLATLLFYVFGDLSRAFILSKLRFLG
jgi:hypothetical protein